MTRKAALKLSFAPDDYLATWQLPTAAGGTFEAYGALTVEAGKPPKGTTHGDFDDALEHMAPGVTGFPQHVDAPVVTGRLSNGASVILINARVTYWVSDQAIINAAAAIITLADVASEGALFTQCEVQIGGLDAIAGVPPIKNTKFPKGIAGTWAAELDPKDFRQEWNDTDATVGLTYFGSFRSFDPYTFGMGFSPVAWCRLEQPVPLRQLLDDWVTPLRRVVSIATGRAEEITYLSLYPGSDDGPEHKASCSAWGLRRSRSSPRVTRSRRSCHPCDSRPMASRCSSWCEPGRSLSQITTRWWRPMGRCCTRATNIRARASSCSFRQSKAPTGTKRKPRMPDVRRSTPKIATRSSRWRRVRSTPSS
ncbi:MULTISPECIES: hypothetical protein [Mumia]|uniref:ApeA N-terminal domain 1-containing protein n=1 Tax=Mumia TaxID=1546255 RepID=UPI001420D637